MTTNESSLPGQACVIGCDVGTQSAKGILVAESGAVLASASAAYDVEFPAPGAAQQDANDWTTAIAEVVAKLTTDAAGPVTHLGVSAQVDGVVPTRPDLTPLHPALIWMDRRAVAESDAAERLLGTDQIYTLTGLTCDAAHAAPKMRWLLDRLQTAPTYLVPPATLVTGWLTGEVAQDHANASSSMLYGITDRCWSGQMLDAFEIDRRLLPSIVDATADIGTVRSTLAARLGLQPTCRVVVGTGDDHGSAVGAGAVRPGVVADVTGTAEPIGTTTSEPVFDVERLVEVHAHAVPDRWFVENGGFVSGGSILWASRLLGITQADVLHRAARTPAGSKGLVFVPALSGSMTPRWNARVRGSFTGLSMDHGTDDLCRAVVEGCVYAARDVIDRLADLGLPVDEIRVCGGGARSRAWLQAKADATGRPVRGLPGDTSALGAACLAAVAAGWYDDVPAAADALAPPASFVVDPDPSTTPVYDAGYLRYRQVFDALEPGYETP